MNRAVKDRWYLEETIDQITDLGNASTLSVCSLKFSVLDNTESTVPGLWGTETEKDDTRVVVQDTDKSKLQGISEQGHYDHLNYFYLELKV